MSRGAKKNLVNRANLAKTFGVSVKTVDKWRDAGCPFEQEGTKGTEWLFCTAAVFRWHLKEVGAPGVSPVAQRGAPEDDGEDAPLETLDQARARKARADATVAEIEAQLAADEVAPLADIIAAVKQEYATVRTLLGSTAGKLAKRLDPDRAIELQPKIADVIDEVLEELSADERLAADGPDGLPGGRRPADGEAPDA